MRVKKQRNGKIVSAVKANVNNGTCESVKINKWKMIYIINVVLTGLFVIFTYWMLALKNGFMLKWYDEMSLFETNVFFFRQYLYFPGGLLRYAGLFLTQFMYYPWLGSVLLIGLWLVIIWLTRKSFRLTDSFFPLAIMLPIVLMVTVLQIDEAWLSMKAPGYVFSNTLGYLFVLVVYSIYCKVEKNGFISVIIALLIVGCYFIAGFYAVVAAGLCIFRSAAMAIKNRKYLKQIEPFIVLSFVIILPKLYYTYFHGNTVDNDYLYLKGLPQLFMDSFDVYLWKPIILSVTLLGVYEIITLVNLERVRYSRGLHWVLITTVLLTGIWSLGATKKSEQLRATVLMLQSIDRNDWRKASNVMSLLEEQPNYSMMVLKNLIDETLGGNRHDLSGYQPSSLDPRHSERFSMTAFVQVPVNYYRGRFNQSYRWSMEHTVQYGKRVFFLKYMVKDAILRGEYKLAKRYNDILLSTMFHRNWAQKMKRYIENPALIKGNDEFVRVLQAREKESVNVLE